MHTLLRSGKRIRKGLLALACAVVPAMPAFGQSFGIELQNTLMPASGAMAGTSIARPQDVTSAVNGNIASLTQYRGTNFSFGGAWAEPTFNMTQTSNLPVVGPPLITPYSAKSNAPGIPAGNIAVSQDLSELGLPVTFGLGFVAAGGGMVDFTQVPQSNGTHSSTTLFALPLGVGVDVTERLSIGAGTSMGIALFDGLFIASGGTKADYALRGTIGANYRLTDATTVGTYYQTVQKYKFDNAFVFNPGPNLIARDVSMDLPQNIGFGIANDRLMDRKLLLAADFTYKLWEDTALFGDIYNNQFVFQLGSQYSLGRLRLRSGYAFAENPIDQNPSTVIGGVPVGSLPISRYSQGLLAVTSQHRISGGVGIVDLLPGLDFDMMAGGMFEDNEQLGPFTATSIESYWLGFGMTWRFGRGSCERLGIPNSWRESSRGSRAVSPSSI